MQGGWRLGSIPSGTTIIIGKRRYWYRLWTHRLCGSSQPGTDPDITDLGFGALSGVCPNWCFSSLTYDWSQSVHGRTPACHAGRRGSLPLGTAKFCTHHLVVRISPFHGEYTGSNPVGCTNSCRGMEKRQLASLISWRSQVRFLLPLPAGLV